jgi:hypothetical protein
VNLHGILEFPCDVSKPGKDGNLIFIRSGPVRVFHKFRDITIVDEGLGNLG